MKSYFLFVSFFLMLVLQFTNTSTYGQSDNLQFKKEIYDVKHCFLNMELDNFSDSIYGNSLVNVQLIQNTPDSLVFDFSQICTTDSVYVNGISSYFMQEGDYLIVPILSHYQKGEMISVQTYYKTSLVESFWNGGIYRKSLPNNAKVTYTLSEPYGSKNWFPCKQVLTDKIDSVWIFITVPDSLLAGSNGLLTNISKLQNNRHRFEWKTNYPIAYYLLSFAVADYIDYSYYAHPSNSDSVLVQNYIYNDGLYLNSNRENINMAGEMIECFSNLFGPYPFLKEKYGHCMAPLGGGMENQTMTTLDNFNFELVAHELAHQWFGDYVTCSDWQNIWINEGFASYSELLALENLKTSYSVSNWLDIAHSIVFSQPGGSIALSEEEVLDPSRIFDYRLTYRKGASIIHMLRHELGDDSLFFEILRAFLKENKNSNANVNDFRTIVEQFSYRNFEHFFSQWFYGEGYPTLNISWETSEDTLTIIIDQAQSAPSKTNFFELLIDFKIDYYHGDTLIQVRQTSPHFSYKIPFQKRAYNIIPDPEKWLLAIIDSVWRKLPEENDHKFNIFPNPSSNGLYIENYFPGNIYNISLYDARGVRIMKLTGSDPIVLINISDLGSGVYQVVITADKLNEIFHLVKN